MRDSRRSRAALYCRSASVSNTRISSIKSYMASRSVCRLQWPRFRPPRRNQGAARGCAAPPAGRCVGGRGAAPRRRRSRDPRRRETTRRCCSIISAEIAGDGHAQAAHPVEVPARALAHGPDGVVLGQVAQPLVERVVEHVEGIEVVGVARPPLRAQVVLQRGHVVLGRELGGAAHAGALQRLADELRVGDRGGRDPGDERAELRDDLDQPLVAQPHQRLADRRAAHAQARGQLVLGELPSGGPARR